MAGRVKVSGAPGFGEDFIHHLQVMWLGVREWFPICKNTFLQDLCFSKSTCLMRRQFAEKIPFSNQHVKKQRGPSYGFFLLITIAHSPPFPTPESCQEATQVVRGSPGQSRSKKIYSDDHDTTTPWRSAGKKVSSKSHLLKGNPEKRRMLTSLTFSAPFQRFETLLRMLGKTLALSTGLHE